MISTHKNQAYDHIRQMMVAGQIQPGSHVSDYTLAKAIGISRAPVREALSRLESEGFLEQIPHCGMFVRKLSRQELHDLYELRGLLETHATERCATTPQDDLVRKLLAHCDALAASIKQRLDAPSADHSAWLRQLIAGDFDFHMLIIQASGNQAITSLAGNARLLINLMSHNHLLPARDPLAVVKRTLREHRRIARAIAQCQPAVARQHMHDHIESARLDVLARYPG